MKNYEVRTHRSRIRSAGFKVQGSEFGARSCSGVGNFTAGTLNVAEHCIRVPREFMGRIRVSARFEAASELGTLNFERPTAPGLRWASRTI